MPGCLFICLWCLFVSCASYATVFQNKNGTKWIVEIENMSKTFCFNILYYAFIKCFKNRAFWSRKQIKLHILNQVLHSLCILPVFNYFHKLHSWHILTFIRDRIAYGWYGVIQWVCDEISFEIWKFIMSTFVVFSVSECWLLQW